MREIKFRVFDNISNRLHDWNTIRNNKFKDFDLEHYNLMQYTGLKDKNGTDIYEGDIVKEYLGGNTVIYSIKWDKGVAKWSIWSGRIIEIIGNIHQNKELL